MKHKTQHLLSIAVTTAFLGTPLIVGAQNENTQATNPATLQSVESCPSLLAELKQVAIEEMEKRVDANFQNVLRWGFCGGIYRGVDDVAADVALAPMPASAPSVANESASEYSETNVQVEGVDEADFVKNDGSYIYMLANGKFRIVDAWPPEQASEIAAVKIEGTPKKLFVHEGRAFIYSSLEPIVQDSYGYSYYYGGNQECTYGYDCEFTGDGQELKITVFDISEVTQPTLVREIRFSGSYLNSRRIGNAVHSAVIFPEPTIANLNYWPNNEWNNALCSGSQNLPSFENIEEIFENLKTKNREIIEAVSVTDWLPSVKDIHYNNGVSQENPNPLVACDNFYQSTSKDGMNFLSLISTDVNGEAPLQATTIFGKPGAVYASTSALYIAAKHSRYTMLTPWWFNNEIDEASTLHKFGLTNNPPASQYDGSGVVKGRILNQFSMDEFKGFFRIATTTSRAPNPNAHSTLSILEQQDNELVVVGQIDNIAPTEDIRSARFIGDKGYIVTFKKTDPLFVFDLSDPHKPAIAGELKIPGFSTYMHRLDDNHLLTIGYDADDRGSFAYFQGIMLQIFDVSDMTNPLLSHKEIIGTRGSTSEAATNHLAFNYFGSKGLLAIPMTICDSGQNGAEQGGRYGDLMTFSGLLVYQVNAENGFELVGGVPHIAPEMQNGENLLRGRMSRTSPAPPSILPATPENYGNFCNNWWTQSNSYVKRSIFMDDYVFSITEDTIKANHLSALGKDIAVVHFEEQPKCDAFHADLCPTEPDCQATNGNWNQELCRLPLYTPLRSSRSFKDLCTATYEQETGILDIPCVKVADTQYNATLSLTNAFPMQQLVLTSNEPVEMKMVMRGCEVTYNPTEATLHVPCIHHQGTAESYWVDFTLLNQTPLTLELTDFGSNR